MRLRIVRTRDEQGTAMIIAIIVILVVSTLSIATLSRALSAMSSARRGQDFSGALGTADSGVSDGLYRLDQQGIGAAGPVCAVGAVAPVSCTVPSIPSVSGVSYTMKVVSDGEVRIRSRGYLNGVPHAVEAIAVRGISFPYALFGNNPGTTALDFNGDSNPITSTDGGDAGVASNGVVDCGNHTPATEVDVYAGGGTSKCGAVTVNTLPGTYTPKPPVSGCPAPVNNPITPCLPTTPAPLACPTVTPASSLIASTVLPGVYRCDKAISFGDIPPLAGNVEIWVFTSTVPAIDMGSGNINYSSNGAVAGDSTKLKVYVNGSAADVTNGNHGFNFSGALWAPDVEITANGCKATYTGSVIVKDMNCNGAPHWTFTYDARFRTIFQSGWRVRNYTEIPSQLFGTP